MNIESVDLIVRNAYIVTMDPDRRVLTNGLIAIKNGVLTAIGTDRGISGAIRADRTIDAHGALVHPGFIDTHIHLLYHNIRWGIEDGAGWGEALPIHQEYGQLVDPDIASVSAKLAALEMARNGTTCFLEAGGVANGDAVSSAIEDVGIRGLLGGPFVRDIMPDSLGTAEEHREVALDNLGVELKRNSDPNGLVRGVVTVSGMGSVSDELLLAAKSMSDDHGVVLNMHQSYQMEDTENDDLRLGRHPLVHYEDIGVLGDNCIFSHVNIVRDDEVRPIVDNRISIAWCPIASMMYGVGGTIHGRHLELYKQGVNIALGCDSANWTSAFDVGEQAFLALLTAREKTGRPDALLAEDVFQMATLNGARAVGMSDRLGSLEVGKRADLIIRRMDIPEAFPTLDPIRSVLYSSRSKSVNTVIVDGEVVIENGSSTRIDEEELFARSREMSNALLERIGRKPPIGSWPRV